MKLFSNFNQKSTLTKIYIWLWSLTGAIIVSIIIMFISLNKTYSETSGKNVYSVSISQDGLAQEEKSQDNNMEFTIPTQKSYEVELKDSGETMNLLQALEKFGDKFKNKVVLGEDNKILMAGTKTSDSNGKYYYQLGNLSGAKPTVKAKRAINATAAVGGIFIISLISALTTTVVAVSQKKKRGGTNNDSNK